MRAPTDLPRRRRSSGRGRTILVVALVVLFFLITSLRGIAGFYTDYLWYESLGRSGVWRGVLGAKVALSVIFTTAFFVLLWVNLVIADRIAPPFRPPGPDEEFIERYHEIVGGRTAWVRVGISVLLAFIAGAGVSSEWNSWLLFTHGGDFGIEDAQFGTDVGFYVFKLPFLGFVSGWLFAALLIVLIVSAVFHYLNGGIRVGSAGQRVTPQVKAHLSVLLGLLALVKAGGYWLQRYDLTVSRRGYVDGAAYTDVQAQLPAINLLLLISIASFVLFIINIWRRGWALPILGVGLWALVAVLAGAVYPQFVQRFQVAPNENEREKPYIARNIEATRLAMGMDDIQVDNFDLNTDKSTIDLAANDAIVRNIRIWDPADNVLGRTFPQLQRTRDYYRVNDVDIDRYVIDDRETQVVLSVRDLNTGNVPQQSWAGRHLAYTHGYGAIVAPANAKNPSGEPSFVAKDVPYDTDEEALRLTEPSVYFGENLSGYVVTGTKQPEIHYRDDEGPQYSTYEGEDGVRLDSFVKRAAFALRFGDPNPLISSQLTGSSKILYLRDIRERAAKLAPFLHFDADPYPVIHDGRVHWIIDAYTTTDRFPYSQFASTDQLPEGSGLDHRFNYVRNSVKTVIDAYDGTVEFYVMDDEDPIIQAYRDAFPDMFTDGDDLPAGLRAHLRYPEDLFRVQTDVWGSYHIEDPDAFYTGDDRWDVARDPGTAGGAAAATQTTGTSVTTTTAPANRQTTSRTARIDPYYLYTQLPGEDEPEFILLRPFVPTAARDDNQRLTAFMVGRSDGEHYGRLQVFEMPAGVTVPGPSLVQGEIESDTEVSEQQRLLDGGGSTVTYGSLTGIPIDGGLVYVRPFYVTSNQSRVPSLQRVIVYFDGEVAIRDTLEQALAAIFGETPPTLEEEDPGDPGGEPTQPEAPSGSTAERVAQLLIDANALFVQADDALAQRDLARYQDLVDQARAKTREAERLLVDDAAAAADAAAAPAATTSSTTSTTAAGASA